MEKRPLPAPPRPIPVSKGGGELVGEPEPFVTSPALDGALEKRDLRSLFWLTLEGVLHGDMTEKLAAIVATLGRAIQALGEEDTDREAAIAESVVIGTVLHGFPPRDEAQWEIARKYFDEHTLAGLVDWKPLDGWFSTVGARQWPKSDEALDQSRERQ